MKKEINLDKLVAFCKTQKPVPELDISGYSILFHLPRVGSAICKNDLPEDIRKHYETINARIRTAEGKASMRRLTVFSIVDTLMCLEKRFNLPKATLNGLKIRADIHAQNFPAAYNYRADSTQFDAEYRNGHWVLTDVYRAECRPGNHEIFCELTDKIKAAIISKYEVIGLG